MRCWQCVFFETVAQAAVTALFKCTDNSWNSDVFSAIKEGSDAEVFCRLDVDSEVINEIDGWSR